MISQAEFEEFIRINNGRMFHREGRTLEFKEQFSLAALADYFRDFAAFANNRGGLLVFGVTDKPRRPVGLSESSIEQFERIDPEKIDGYLLDIFSSSIRWTQALFEISGECYGVFQVFEASMKPVIAKRNEGKSGQIRNGEIYFRYGGRTQRILHAELQELIESRVERVNQRWVDLMSKIAQAGPQHAEILDTNRGVIERNDDRLLVLDEQLIQDLKFIREGEFSEREGAPTLKLVGEVIPVNQVRVPTDLTERYPLSATEVAEAVKDRLPDVGKNQVWRAIAT
ncbi:MAG: ATP-binding protein, partial [Thermomicrobiaceae bacterium]